MNTKFLKTKLIAVLFALVAITGCRKDDDTPAEKLFPKENPLAMYFQKTGFDEELDKFTNTDFPYESGLGFVPKVKGKINAVTIKIPDDAANVRVTIWDATTKTSIRTITISSVKADVEMKQAIDPLEIVPTGNYMITFNSDDYYVRKRTDGLDVTYPVDAGNISITGYSYSIGTAQTFPTYLRTNYYGGDVSFVFQQTE